MSPDLATSPRVAHNQDHVESAAPAADAVAAEAVAAEAKALDAQAQTIADPTRSRRSLLRGAAAAASGAVAATLAGAAPTLGATGNPAILGASNEATITTLFSLVPDLGANTVKAMSGAGAAFYGVSSGGNGVYGESGASPAPGVAVAAVLGIATSSAHGLAGFSASGTGVLGNGDAGAGVVGRSVSSYGVQGVATDSALAGVRAENTSAIIGAVALSAACVTGPAIDAQSSGDVGLYARSLGAAAVFAEGVEGVVAGSTSSGASYGVRAQADGDGSTGVRGASSGAAARGVHGDVTGEGATGVRGDATGLTSTGVYGRGTLSGVRGIAGVQGVWGSGEDDSVAQDAGSLGVRGTSPSVNGAGVRAESIAATGGRALQGIVTDAATGIGLEVNGRVRLTSRSGRVRIAKGKAAAVVKVAGVTAGNFAIGTLGANRAGTWIRAVVCTAGTVTIYTNVAVTADTYATWLVLG